MNEYTYLGVRITKDGNGEPEINDRISRGRAAVTKLNGVLWDCDGTPKTKTHIYHAAVNSAMTYVAETGCLIEKTTAEINSTVKDFWRLSARICRKDKIINNIIKQKLNVTRSPVEDIKTKQLQCADMSTEWRRGGYQKSTEMAAIREKKTGGPKLTWAEGIRGMMGEKGLMEEDWTDRSKWRKKII